MLFVLLELTFVDSVLFMQFSESIVLAFLKFPDVLKRGTNHLSETIWLTVPHLTLVSSAIFILIATLSCALPVYPFTSIRITILEYSPSLTMFFALGEVTGINVPS